MPHDTFRIVAGQDETYRTLCKISRMEEAFERLQRARANAGYQTPSDAARAFGWNEITYRAHENGGRGLKKDVAERYAKAFRISPAWLLTGEGKMERGNVVAVRGRIGAGAEISPEDEQVPPEGLYEIEAPFPVPDDAIAFEVVGDSMWPRYDPGDVIVCWKPGISPLEVLGWEAAVKTADGKRFLKRVLRGAEKNTFDLESYNTPPIRGVHIEWCASIQSVIRSGQWRKLDERSRARMLKKMVE